MLDYLVTSRTRRALLEILWLDAEAGAAASLARKAGVGFASAYRELKEMARFDLVRVEVEHGLEVYRANRQHPMAGHLRALIEFRPRRYPPPTDADDALRGQLAEVGVPIHAAAAPPFDGPIEDLLARGARLAQRDPSLAVAYPVGVWRARHRIDAARLADAASRHCAARPLGFLLDVTAELAGDAALRRAAASLRDQRVRADQDFFTTSAASGRAAAGRPPAAARRWRYRIPVARDELAAMFEKYRAASDDRA